MKEVIKYLNEEGLLYLLQLLETGVDNKIEKAIADKFVLESGLDKKIEDLANNGPLITEDELTIEVEKLKDLIEDNFDTLKAEIEAEMETVSKASARESVEEIASTKVAEFVNQKITGGLLLTTASAEALYLKKSGDTMTGNLNCTNVDASGTITAQKFKVGNITFYV